MKAFPTTWGNIRVAVATPIDTPCLGCKVPIKDGDVGIVLPHVSAEGSYAEEPWHRQCFLDALGITVGHA